MSMTTKSSDGSANATRWLDVERVRAKLLEVLDALLQHPGFGDMHVSMKILNHGKKEVILSCGKQYRFVLKPSDPTKVEEGGD